VRYLGVDPGLASGALAVLDEGGQPVVATIMPRLGKKGPLDWWLIYQWIAATPAITPEAAYVEKVGAMPGQGVTSMFNFGGAFHGIQAVLACSEVPYELVTPQAWKKRVLAGLDWKGNKGCSIEFCRRKWPNWNLRATPRSRTDSDNIADALCIAYYGYLMGRNV
jgi:crossover junction endodeoxyribonuclease RuvC